jgi:RNA polymerase sigma-70 factor (ECF subfamily)
VANDEAPAFELLAAGDLRAATAWVLRSYGSEVYGYVHTLLKNPDDAADAFAVAAEQVFMNIARFRGEASLRTWFYRIARHAAFADRRRPGRARVSVSELAHDLHVAVRTATLEYQKSEIKNAVAELRAQLAPEDRELLVLRVDRDLSWNDVALVLLGGDGLDVAELKREAARARKRFERIKDELRDAAQQAGLLD